MQSAEQIYFFQSSDARRYALSTDVTGCNVPRNFGAWLLRGELVPDELPSDFEAIVEHLNAHGFSILKVEET
jgi:hypothetical protein